MKSAQDILIPIQNEPAQQNPHTKNQKQEKPNKYLNIQQHSNKQNKLKETKIDRRTYSFSPSLTWAPPNSGKRTLSPSFTVTGIKFPALSRPPGPTATTFPEFNYTHQSVQSEPLD